MIDMRFMGNQNIIKMKLTSILSIFALSLFLIACSSNDPENLLAHGLGILIVVVK